jgi:hypothetical protein
MSDANAAIECYGVFCQRIQEMQPYHNAPNYMSCSGDYHNFAKHGDKVYMEVRNAGEIVISFAELQKTSIGNITMTYHFMLANDKHKVIKNETFNKLYEEIYGYTAGRVYTGDKI